MQKPATKSQNAEGGLWDALQADALETVQKEPALEAYLRSAILDRRDLGDMLGTLLARKLGGEDLTVAALQDICSTAFAADPEILKQYVRDLQACHKRDPACRTWLQPAMYYKGVAATQAYRVTHWLWTQGRETLAMHLQSLSSQVFQVDIHPAAKLGGGLFLDHATGIVIGETSVVGDDVTILQSVTLGGNGKERGDRHPKVSRGVLISVGAKLLGNIKIGEEARIAASAVVLHDVEAHTTVAGAPAKPVRGPVSVHPAADLDHVFGPNVAR